MTITIRTHFSDFFEVSPETVDTFGAFNVSLINDLPLFVDPFLLFNSAKPEYQELHHGILKYLRFLRDRASCGPISPGLIRAWYAFPEVKQTWLGFSLVGNEGSGLGRDFGNALSENLASVLSNFGGEEITRSSHLEKVCLIRPGVGRDNISDFTTNLIKRHLCGFTQRFSKAHLRPDQCSNFAVDHSWFNYETSSWVAESYLLPKFQGDFVLLTPKDILTKDETWICKRDMFRQFDDIVDALPNEALRAQLNAYFFRCLPEEPTSKERREAKASTILNFPQFVDHFMRFKEDAGESAVWLSKQNVADVESLFIKRLKELVYLLYDQTSFYSTEGTTYGEARERVLFLKDVIENKGGQRLFFDNSGTQIRRESDLQILYRLCWFATPSDVSRETNDGRGPVDYKISRGARDKTLVEFKLASNTQLRRNLENQVEVYQRASDAGAALKVILAFSDVELERVAKILTELGLHNSPHVIVIDANQDNKPSGSKA